MKKAIVFNNSAFVFPQTEAMFEDAEELKQAGYDVLVVRCGRSLEACFCNPEGYSAICLYCEACHKNMYRLLSKGFRFERIRRMSAKSSKFNIRTMQDIKAIVYRGVYVGYGVLSSYATAIRGGNFEFADSEVAILERKLNEACAYVDAICEILDKEKPDVISIFNGRLIEARPFFDLARFRNIKVRVVETVAGELGTREWRRIVYNGCLPHDIDANTQQVIDLWNSSTLPVEERRRIGEEFFRRKVAGLQMNDVDISFTHAQTKGLLPNGFDSSAKNIVIFNSSEDEFISVGREFDQYDIFSNQIVGIRAICDALKDTEYKVVIRMHPNLSSVTDKYVTSLYDLPKEYPNVTVVPPDSMVSSYTLLFNAEKVVTFGSTIGIEAVYWNKPSVLLRGAYYMKLGGCYVPKTPAEAAELVKAELLPQSSEGAIKYGFWVMKNHLTGMPMTRFRCKLKSFRPRFIFGKWLTPECLTVGGSAAMATLIARFLNWMPWIMSPRKVKWPKKLFCTYKIIAKR